MTWFRIEREDGHKAHGSIFGELGAFGQTADDFVAALAGVAELDLFMDCPGGDALAALQIAPELRSRKTTITITGHCGSAGLFAAMGAETIQCVPTARLLIHSPMRSILANASELHAAADGLDITTRKVEELIRAKTEQPEEVVHDWLSRDSWFSAQEALAVGLVDEIIQPAKPRRSKRAAQSDTYSPAALAPVPESEAMFRAFLTAFGPVEVRDVENFRRDLLAWSATAGNVRQIEATATTP